MTRISDVAARAGVSVSTVSRAMRGRRGVSEQTRAVVAAAATELGYVASPGAAGLSTGRTGAVGVVSTWMARWFCTVLIQGVQEVMAEHDYEVLLYDVGGAQEVRRRVFDAWFLPKRADAVLIPSMPLTGQEVAALAELCRPVVMIGPVVPGLSGVRANDVEVGRQATAHLLELGHRRIGFVGGELDAASSVPVTLERHAGYELALRTADLEPDPALTIPAGFSVDGGIAAFPSLVDRADPPTAIVAASDEIAMGLLYATRQAGIAVPEELSVIGVDDHEMARLFGLTTIAQPVHEQGRAAACLALDRIRAPEPQPPEVITVPTSLVVRATTAPRKGTFRQSGSPLSSR